MAIQSTLEVGTKVTVEIPYREINFYETPERHLEELFEDYPEPCEVNKAARFSFSILLVEDDPVNAEIEAGILRKLGCHVLCVNSAFKAIEILNHKSFDLIFIDITLPDVTGINLADTIRYTLPPTTQMVAVTSHTSDVDEDYFLSHGIMTMLKKPLTQEDFIKFFEDYLFILDQDEE